MFLPVFTDGKKMVLTVFMVETFLGFLAKTSITKITTQKNDPQKKSTMFTDEEKQKSRKRQKNKKKSFACFHRKKKHSRIFLAKTQQHTFSILENGSSGKNLLKN